MLPQKNRKHFVAAASRLCTHLWDYPRAPRCLQLQWLTYERLARFGTCVFRRF